MRNQAGQEFRSSYVGQRTYRGNAHVMSYGVPRSPDAAYRRVRQEPHSTAVTPRPKPSSATLLIAKAFAIGFALVVAVSLMTGVIMDLMGMP